LGRAYYGAPTATIRFRRVRMNAIKREESFRGPAHEGSGQKCFPVHPDRPRQDKPERGQNAAQ
jgi:hypothetical protein